MLSAGDARARFPVAASVAFDVALWCASEGVVDIPALLTRYLRAAREAGFRLRTSCRVEDLVTEGGRVTGVQTPLGQVDADMIGPDPDVPGLFHVSALSGFGMGTSAVVGELAATLLASRTPDWIEAGPISPAKTVVSTQG